MQGSKGPSWDHPQGSAYTVAGPDSIDPGSLVSTPVASAAENNTVAAKS